MCKCGYFTVYSIRNTSVLLFINTHTHVEQTPPQSLHELEILLAVKFYLNFRGRRSYNVVQNAVTSEEFVCAISVNNVYYIADIAC